MEEVEEPRQKDRGRKKQLLTTIRQTMEFYFSPSNLAKESWMSQTLKKNGSIDLKQFLTFNKIRALTNNVKDISKALKYSTKLIIEDGSKVKPKVLEFKTTCDQCTIYIEQIPPDADHDWLTEMFSSFGKIDYVSIPKFMQTKKNKGFAFVEFAEIESAKNAIEEYKKVGSYLSTTDMKPQDLLSISTFNYEHRATTDDQNNGNMPNEVQIAMKRKHDKDKLPEEIIVKVKKEKKDSTAIPVTALTTEIEININGEEETKEEESINGREETKEKEIINDEEVNDQQEVTDNINDVTKKKNRNKKKKIKKTKVTAETSGLQILSRQDWKTLRNKYLNMKKSKMELLKKHLNQTKGKVNYRNADCIKEKVSKEEATIVNTSDVQLGSIVKIKLTEPVIDVQQFKRDVRTMKPDVKYIDVKEGATTIHFRLDSPEAAKQFCENSTWPETEIITGSEEQEYFKVVARDREHKRSKNFPKIKERGKEKLLKKAEKLLGQHIIFDD